MKSVLLIRLIVALALLVITSTVLAATDPTEGLFAPFQNIPEVKEFHTGKYISKSYLDIYKRSGHPFLNQVTLVKLPQGVDTSDPVSFLEASHKQFIASLPIAFHTSVYPTQWKDKNLPTRRLYYQYEFTSENQRLVSIGAWFMRDHKVARATATFQKGGDKNSNDDSRAGARRFVNAVHFINQKELIPPSRFHTAFGLYIGENYDPLRFPNIGSNTLISFIGDVNGSEAYYEINPPELSQLYDRYTVSVSFYTGKLTMIGATKIFHSGKSCRVTFDQQLAKKTKIWGKPIDIDRELFGNKATAIFQQSGVNATLSCEPYAEKEWQYRFKLTAQKK